MFDEIADRAVADACQIAGSNDPRTSAEFDARVEAGRARVADCGAEVLRVARGALLALKAARAALGLLNAPVFAQQREAVRRQLEALLAPGWARRTPEPWFFQLPKYLQAAARRLERRRNDVDRDRKLQVQVAPFEAVLRELDSGLEPDRPRTERERLRWMVEEFRVSLFAQELRTLTPVSAKRLEEQACPDQHHPRAYQNQKKPFDGRSQLGRTCGMDPREIEKCLSGRVRYRTTEIISPEAYNEPFAAQTKPGVPSEDELMQHPEVRQQVARMLEGHWSGWIDMRIPTLGGKTPRQAVKTADGRESVAALLAQAERDAARFPQMPEVALEAIRKTRRQLGLS